MKKRNYQFYHRNVLMGSLCDFFVFVSNVDLLMTVTLCVGGTSGLLGGPWGAHHLPRLDQDHQDQV